jgi:hypothetical protein
MLIWKLSLTIVAMVIDSALRQAGATRRATGGCAKVELPVRPHRRVLWQGGLRGRRAPEEWRQPA